MRRSREQIIERIGGWNYGRSKEAVFDIFVQLFS